MRNRQVSRLLCIISILERRPSGLTISEIKSALEARGFTACSRTIYRDVDGLAESGFPLFPEDSSEICGQRWVYKHHLSIGKLLGAHGNEEDARLWSALGGNDAVQLLELAARLRERANSILEQAKQAA